MENKNFKKISFEQLEDLTKNLDNIYISTNLDSNDKISFCINADKKEIEDTVSLKELEKKINNLTNIVESGFQKIDTQFNLVNARLDKIENCPTIQKELSK